MHISHFSNLITSKKFTDGELLKLTSNVRDPNTTIIAGTLINPEGDPLENAPVILIKKDINDHQEIINQVLTDKDGYYLFAINDVDSTAKYSIKATG